MCIVIALRFLYCDVFIHQKILRSQHNAARYNPKEPQSAVFAHLTDAVVCVLANNICIDAVTNDMAVYNYFKTKPLCILLGCHNFPIALNAMATTTRTWTRRQRWRQMVVGCGGKTNDFGFGFGAPRHAFHFGLMSATNATISCEFVYSKYFFESHNWLWLFGIAHDALNVSQTTAHISIIYSIVPRKTLRVTRIQRYIHRTDPTHTHTHARAILAKKRGRRCCAADD